MTTAAKKIHPFRSSGVNPRPEALQGPQDAATVQQALDGLQRAAAGPGARLVAPRFASTAGPWLRLGEHETRVPTDVAISVSMASDGRNIAVVAHLDESDDAGRVQVLVDTAEGIRELVGLVPQQLRELRREHFGK